MLKTSRVAGNLCIEIHPRKSWRIVFNLLLVGFWGACFFGSLAGFENRANINRSTVQGAGMVALTLAVFLWMLFTTLKDLLYFELVTIAPDVLRIQGSLLSFGLTNRSFDNSSISELRYEEWSGGRSGPQNGIRFLCNDQTVTFARQADSQDSWDLIDRAREVYPFAIPAPTQSPAVTSW